MFSLKVLHKVLRSFAFNFPIDIKRLVLLNQSSLRKEKRIENLARQWCVMFRSARKVNNLNLLLKPI